MSGLASPPRWQSFSLSLLSSREDKIFAMAQAIGRRAILRSQSSRENALTLYEEVGRRFCLCGGRHPCRSLMRIRRMTMLKRLLSTALLLSVASATFVTSEQSAEARCCRQRCHRRRCCNAGCNSGCNTGCGYSNYSYSGSSNCSSCSAGNGMMTTPQPSPYNGSLPAPNAPSPSPAPPPAPST
jgi:hypothetical protein